MDGSGNRLFCVSTGAVALLLQDENGIYHPLCFFFKKFNRHQCNYSTIEKESLALLLALKKFEVYVGSSSQPVEVFTDHNPLVFLQMFCNKNQRLIRWALICQDFYLNIKYKKGKDNVIADSLLRTCS